MEWCNVEKWALKFVPLNNLDSEWRDEKEKNWFLLKKMLLTLSHRFNELSHSYFKRLFQVFQNQKKIELLTFLMQHSTVSAKKQMRLQSDPYR